MGLPEDLNLRGNELNDCASAISWSFLAMTAIVPLALNKAPIGKWVGVNMVSRHEKTVSFTRQLTSNRFAGAQ